MKADELDAKARLRMHVREVIADLRRYGVADDDMRGKSIWELDEMHDRATKALMAAPTP